MKTLYFPAGEYVVTQPLVIPPPPSPPKTAVAAGDDAGWVNVKDYGAVGDGETDDTSAINEAIEALNR